MINHLFNGKVRRILLIVELIKNTFLYRISYFPKPYSYCKNKLEVELDLSIYATKSD